MLSGAMSRCTPASARSRSARSDRKSTRLNSSHANISYAVFCLKKKRYLYHPTAVIAVGHVELTEIVEANLRGQLVGQPAVLGQVALRPVAQTTPRYSPQLLLDR